MELTVTTVVLLILIPMLVWRTYSRLRMVFARQQSVMWKHYAGAIFFPIVLASSASSMTHNVLSVSLLGTAALCGGWLAVFSLKKTRFEINERGFFFTPHLRTGMVICMLFLARVLQIAVEFYLNRQSQFPKVISHDEVMQHPLTVITFGLFAGYFAIYSIGMLRWRMNHKALPGQE
ncbi:hypothetical protein [Pseudoduganella sp. RAF53_2]|uniref:hypothetical protein n=1 Tax=unclassified Pseudoduganella TaxID=2637179 RepID=UPI003F9928EE